MYYSAKQLLFFSLKITVSALGTSLFLYMYTYVISTQQFIIIFFPIIHSIQIQNLLIVLSEAGRVKDLFLGELTDGRIHTL